MFGSVSPGSSGDSEDCAIGSQGLRVPTQKSYSSSETLKAFDQHQDQTRLEPKSHTMIENLYEPVSPNCIDAAINLDMVQKWVLV